MDADLSGPPPMTAADDVVDALRRDILSGVFAPGERLVEADLCDRYGCGRSVVRAAIVQLEGESLVDRKANKGAVVHPIPVSEAVEITEARIALESLIAARAARQATADDGVALRRIIDEMRLAVADDDASAYSALNRELHGRLQVIAGHSVAMELVRNLRNRGVQNQFRLAVMPGRREESIEQHAAIVEAVVAGDEDAASTAMADHLASVIDVLSQWGDARGVVGL